MRSIRRCYSDHAIKVADSYCSGPSGHHYQSHLSPNLAPSIQRAVSSCYRVKLSTDKRFLISITWSSPGFTISVADWPCPSSSPFKNSRKIEKAKGWQAMESCSSRSEVFWDLSDAEYDAGRPGPEPVKGFYILVMIDSEMALFHGDKACCNSGGVVGKQRLISRSEYFSGSSAISAVARFSETGRDHDICFRWTREGKSWGMCVSVDKRSLIQVKRLEWNFRGNQTIFLDGLMVDMMWDVHDWLFKGRSGCGVFLFRTRSGVDSRLWLDEKNLQQKEDDDLGFSFLISASCNKPD